jgi:hypothetical protein
VAYKICGSPSASLRDVRDTCTHSTRSIGLTYSSEPLPLTSQCTLCKSTIISSAETVPTCAPGETDMSLAVVEMACGVTETFQSLSCFGDLSSHVPTQRYKSCLSIRRSRAREATSSCTLLHQYTETKAPRCSHKDQPHLLIDGFGAE